MKRQLRMVLGKSVAKDDRNRSESLDDVGVTEGLTTKGLPEPRILRCSNSAIQGINHSADDGGVYALSRD